MLAYRLYNAGAVIHTHSPKAVMVTLLWPGKEFRCTHLEMIKVNLIQLIYGRVILTTLKLGHLQL